jgi:small subunit ribosomal protein S21
MFRKKRKKKKASSLLYVDASNKSIDRALAEFKKRVKNSNLLKELREREFYEKPSVTARRLRKLRLRKVKKLHTN